MIEISLPPSVDSSYRNPAVSYAFYFHILDLNQIHDAGARLIVAVFLEFFATA
jgi:hypothetical protein